MLISGALTRFVPFSIMPLIVGVEDVWFWIAVIVGVTKKIAVSKDNSI